MVPIADVICEPSLGRVVGVECGRVDAAEEGPVGGKQEQAVDVAAVLG